EPVALAAEQPVVTITAPAYAGSESETSRGLDAVQALQHSQVTFAFAFTRPAAGATLVWKTKDGEGPVALTVAEDRRSATATIPQVKVTGQYRLVMEAEHGVKSEAEGGGVVVRPDLPPQFLRVAGWVDKKSVLPYERLPLEAVVTDDVGVACLEVEYRVNGGEPQVEPVPLGNVNLRDVTARHVFSLAGQVKDRQGLPYRLRLQDNLPPEFGGPHTVHFPPADWWSLKVVRQAKPLEEQELLAQQREIDARVEALKQTLQKEQRAAYKLNQESRDNP